MSTKTLPNKLKKDVVGTISSIICRSFGPENQMTLLSTSTGKVVVTSDGMAVLGALHLSHPVAKLVVESLRRHHHFTGDGTKTFLLYLSQAMRDLEKLEIQSSPLCLTGLESTCNSFWNRMSMQFMKIERDILPQICNELYALSLVKTVGECSVDILKSVIFTALFSQLSRNNSDLFESIVLETLTGYPSQETSNTTLSYVQQKVEFMLNNFDFLHLKLSKHLTESSSSLQGFLLRRDFSLKCTQLNESSPVRFALLLCSIEGKTCDNPDELVQLKDQDSAYKAFTYRVTTARTYLKVLKGTQVSLVLCSEKVPDYVLSVCREYGVSVVCCVEEEDIRFLERVTGMQSVTSPIDAVSGRHIGELSGCQGRVIGSQRFVHLQFPEEISSRLPGMIITAAPTDGMVDELTSVIYKTYKSVQMCFCYQKSFKHYVKSGQADDIRSDCATTDNSTSNHSEFAVVGGGGYFEIQTAALFKKLSGDFSDLDIGLGCRILHDCLLSVPRSLHKNSSRSRATEATDYLQKLQTMVETVKQGKVVGLDGRGRICNPVEDGILEPVESKISVLSSVVQLLQQLIRIDSVVSVKKFNNSSSDSDN